MRFRESEYVKFESVNTGLTYGDVQLAQAVRLRSHLYAGILPDSEFSRQGIDEATVTSGRAEFFVRRLIYQAPMDGGSSGRVVRVIERVGLHGEYARLSEIVIVLDVPATWSVALDEA